MTFEIKRDLKKKKRDVIAFGNQAAKEAANKAVDQTTAFVNHASNKNTNSLDTQKFHVDLQAQFNEGKITESTLLAALRKSGVSEEETLMMMQNCGALNKGKGKASEYRLSERVDDNIPLPKEEAARRNKEFQEEREAEFQEREWHEEKIPEPVSVPKPRKSPKQPPGAFSSITSSTLDRLPKNSIKKIFVSEDLADNSNVNGDIVHGSLYKKGDFSQGVSPTEIVDYSYTRNNRGGNNLLIFVLGFFGIFFGIGVVFSLYHYTKIKAALSVAKKFNDDEITIHQAEFLLLNELNFSPEKTRAFLLGKDEK